MLLKSLITLILALELCLFSGLSWADDEATDATKPNLQKYQDMMDKAQQASMEKNKVPPPQATPVYPAISGAAPVAPPQMGVNASPAPVPSQTLQPSGTTNQINPQQPPDPWVRSNPWAAAAQNNPWIKPVPAGTPTQPPPTGYNPNNALTPNPAMPAPGVAVTQPSITSGPAAVSAPPPPANMFLPPAAPSVGAPNNPYRP